MDFYPVLSSALSSAAVAAIAWLARRMSREMGGLKADFEAVKQAQRNQLKASIVRSFNEASERGFIYATELETMNRRFDSYEELDGNSYVRAIVARANEGMEIRGEIPAH